MGQGLFTIPEQVVFLRAFILIIMEFMIFRHGGHRVPDEVTDDAVLLGALRCELCALCDRIELRLGCGFSAPGSLQYKLLKI